MDSTRQDIIDKESTQPYFITLHQHLAEQIQQGTTIYPPSSLIFNAFEQTPRDDLKVVVLGQDPYHGPKQAMGLSFSVPESVAIPPSLKNIYKEIEQSTGQTMPAHGDLTRRATQGVLLLNAILTVQASQAASHRKLGREHFTDTIIKTISDRKEGIIFLLRGSFATSKQTLIDTSKHHILTSVHPSPLSAHRGFLGCGHFATVNDILTQQGKEKIVW